MSEEKSILNLYINSLTDAFHGGTIIKKSAPFVKIVKFFQLYDWINTTAYYKNLTDLKCQYAFYIDSGDDAIYETTDNVIKYKDEKAIVHELFHMASNPYRQPTQSGLVTKNGQNIALDEGVTEYFATIVEPTPKVYYPIETLVIELLVNSFGLAIFKDYFNADYNAFLSNFKDQGAINRLAKKLDFHHESYIDSNKKELNDPLQQKRLELLQKDIIKDVITIIYENETSKKTNKLDELEFIVASAIKNRKIEHGYNANYNLLEYAKNIIKSIREQEKKKVK